MSKLTVNDLIERLKGFPGDAVVVIIDADTGWPIFEPKIALGKHNSDSGIREEPNEVYIWADYGEFGKE